MEDLADELKRWEKDYLDGAVYVAIKRRAARPRGGRVGSDELRDGRLELQLAMTELQDIIRLHLRRELARLVSEIESERLPPEIAIEQFEHRSADLLNFADTHWHMEAEKRLVKFENDRDNDCEGPLSKGERDEFQAKYEAAAAELHSESEQTVKKKLYSERGQESMVLPRSAGSRSPSDPSQHGGPDPKEAKRAQRFVPFPTPPGTGWHNVEIRFLDGETVRIRLGAVDGVYTCSEMGMASKRNGNSTVQWKLLLIVARANGSLTWRDPQADSKNQKRRENLSRNLREFFQIEGDPFSLIKGRKGWRANFTLLPER